jgi:hypothetical protein
MSEIKALALTMAVLFAWTWVMMWLCVARLVAAIEGPEEEDEGTQPLRCSTAQQNSGESGEGVKTKG